MAAKRIDRNINTNEEADVKDGILLNPTTSIKIADADPERIHFSVSIRGEPVGASLFIKYQPATTDDAKKGRWLGIVVMGNDTVFRVYDEMPKDNVYTGEISAIADSGNPEIFVTEY